MSTQTMERQDTARYGVVFAILAIFTLLEAGTAYLPTLPSGIKIGILVFLAAVKVVLVLLYFMHLRHDNRLFAMPFALGAVVIVPLILVIGLTMPQSMITPEAVAVDTTGQVIDVTEVSFMIHMSQYSAQAGPVTFHIVNGADDMLHEFLIIQTDLPADQLPTEDNGDAAEDQVTIIKSAENIPPSQSRNLNLNLAAGHYVMICNLPGHYQQGMRVNFTVTGSGVGEPSTPQSTAAPAPTPTP